MKEKLLIVDDKAVNRYVLKEIFEDQFDITECQDGWTAMKVLEEYRNEITAVLLDIIMPMCDGFAVLNYMKEIALYSIPVILISANTDDKNYYKACEYGVADYIQKPFQEDVVRQRVQRVIEIYRNKKERMF